MSRAYKCDSCGEYCDDEPTIINLVPPAIDKKTLRYDLCPFCSDLVIEVISRECVFEDIGRFSEASIKSVIILNEEGER